MGAQINLLKATAAKDKTALIAAHNEKFHKNVDDIGSQHEKEVADLVAEHTKLVNSLRDENNKQKTMVSERFFATIPSCPVLRASYL